MVSDLGRASTFKGGVIQGCWHRVQSPEVAPLPLDIVAADQPPAELLEEAQHVVLPAALLAVEPEQLQLSPVVQLLQHWVPDPTDLTSLTSLPGSPSAPTHPLTISDRQ